MKKKNCNIFHSILLLLLLLVLLLVWMDLLLKILNTEKKNKILNKNHNNINRKRKIDGCMYFVEKKYSRMCCRFSSKSISSFYCYGLYMAALVFDMIYKKHWSCG